MDHPHRPHLHPRPLAIHRINGVNYGLSDQSISDVQLAAAHQPAPAHEMAWFKPGDEENAWDTTPFVYTSGAVTVPAIPQNDDEEQETSA